MSEYSKLTVANLKAMLKERGIPLTGMSRKQQFIDRLEEADKEQAAADDEPEGGEDAEGEEEEEEEQQEIKVGGAEEEEKTGPTAESEPTTAATAAPATTTTATSPEPDKPVEEVVEEEEVVVVVAEVPEKDTIAVAEPVTEERKEEEEQERKEEAVKGEEIVVEATEATTQENSPPAAEEESTDAVVPTESTTANVPAPAPAPASTTEEPAVLPSHETVEALEARTATRESSAQVSTAGSLAQTQSRVDSEEVTEDRKKRKRRSVTPPVREKSVAKKLRPSEPVEQAIPAPVKAQQDVDMADAETTKVDVPMEDVGAEKNQDIEPVVESAPTTEKQPQPPKDEKDVQPSKEDHSPPARTPVSATKEKDARFKSLFPPRKPAVLESTEAAVPPSDREIPPALHSATPAVYIRNFMRPLQLNTLKNHLASLATPPGSSPNPNVLQSFYVDPIRTHALCLFSSTSAAARVRASLHEAVWPAERDRKPLWVDFVPEDKVAEWISIEEQDGGGRPGRGGSKRWEVVYEEVTPTRDADPAASTIVAIHCEVGSSNGAPRGSNTAAIPSGPRRPAALEARITRGPPSPIHRQDTTTTTANNNNNNNNNNSSSSSSSNMRNDYRPTAPRQPDKTKASFVALDALFRSTTTAKPKLYFLPVSDDIARRRLDELDRVTSRDWMGGKPNPRDRWAEQRRFTFETLTSDDGGSADGRDSIIRVIDNGPLFSGGGPGGSSGAAGHAGAGPSSGGGGGGGGGGGIPSGRGRGGSSYRGRGNWRGGR